VKCLIAQRKIGATVFPEFVNIYAGKVCTACCVYYSCPYRFVYYLFNINDCSFDYIASDFRIMNVELGTCSGAVG
jgi:hypothetical protein